MADVKKSRYAIEQIEQKHSISEYLNGKGIQPHKSGGGKSFYLCPLHKDSKPSFIVYDNEDGHQSCFCWGCKFSSNVIGLAAALENISWHDAIRKFSDGIDLSDKAELDYLVRLLKEDIEKKTDKVRKDVKDFSSKMLSLGVMGFDHLSNCEMDEEEFKFLEELYKKVDSMVWSYDMDAIKDTYDMISNKEIIVDGAVFDNPMHYRCEQWQKRHNKKLVEESKVADFYEKV